MDEVVSRYFIESFFTESKKQYSEKVLEYIIQSMVNRISNVEWLDDETIEYAYKKISAMKTNIGYPNYILNGEFLNKMYGQVEINEDDFFNTINKIYQIVNMVQIKYLDFSFIK